MHCSRHLLLCSWLFAAAAALLVACASGDGQPRRPSPPPPDDGSAGRADAAQADLAPAPPDAGLAQDGELPAPDGGAPADGSGGGTDGAPPADAGPGEDGGEAAPPDGGGDAGPPPSGLCGPCATDADCDLFLVCADGDDGQRFCTGTCIGPVRCQAGYECRRRQEGLNLCYPSSGSCDNPCLGLVCPAGEFCNPRTGECRTPRQALCEPCTDNDECGSPADLCLANPYSGETFCAMRCAQDADCPDGYLCINLADGDRQCYPELATCHDPCLDARCPEGTFCSVVSGGRCFTSDQTICAGPCVTQAQCGAPDHLCISFPDQPAYCARPCSNARCAGDADCGAQGLVCQYGRCTGCQANEQCPPLTICRWGSCVSDCPEDTFCADVVDQRGEVVSAQCAPADGECESDHLGELCGAEHPGACGGMNPECSDPVREGFCTRPCRWDRDCPRGWRDCHELDRDSRLCFAEPLRGPDGCGVARRAANELGIGGGCGGQEGLPCAEGLFCLFSGEFEQTRSFCTRSCSGEQAPPEECGPGAFCGMLASGGWGWTCLPEECRCLQQQQPQPGGRYLLREAIGPFLYPCNLGLLERELNQAPAALRDVTRIRRGQELGLRYAAAALDAALAQQEALAAAMAGEAPLGAALRVAAAAAEIPVVEPGPLPLPAEEPFVAGLAALFAAAGEPADLAALRQATAGLPDVLQEEVAPLLFALARAAELREVALLALEELPDPAGHARVMHEVATALLAYRRDELSRPLTADVLDDFVDHGLGFAELVEAALTLADAVDRLDRPRLAGLLGFSFHLATPLGWVILADAAAQQHDPQQDRYDGPIALLLDTGGDDTYLVPAGANAGPEQPAALCLDLGGDDEYRYRVYPDPHDQGLLPSDRWGRLAPEELQGEGLPGPFTFSEENRQGAGRLGVGILADFGGGRDHYRSLRFSQGAGAMGVGLLLDDGGDDRYEAEAFAQGAAAFGLGLLLDLGGQDSYRSWTLSQGLGGPIGLGLLADATGDDTYLAEPGTPAAEEEAGGDGPAPLYPTGDDPEGRSNASRSQGAAIGYRRLEGGAPLDLAGGIGLLLDGEGADSYQADVQAQGFGFWWGTGLLADGQGPDQYDLRALGQACAFFFGLGLLLEGGGDDRYNLRRPDGLLYLLGTGAEYGSGLLLEEGGDDQYVAPAAALGVGLANGLGLLLERSGADSYRAGSLLTLGHARSLDDDEQPVRRNGRTVGVFVDGGGVDSYSREDLAEVEPQPPNKPGNDRRWEQQSNPELFWEQGRGIDGEGWGGM